MNLADMNLIEQRIKANALAELRKREPHQNYTGSIMAEIKDVPIMQVSYNGFTGLLLKLETRSSELGLRAGIVSYSLDIWDAENGVTYSFANVKLEDVKFLGGVVSFGG